MCFVQANKSASLLGMVLLSARHSKCTLAPVSSVSWKLRERAVIPEPVRDVVPLMPVCPKKLCGCAAFVSFAEC